MNSTIKKITIAISFSIATLSYGQNNLSNEIKSNLKDNETYVVKKGDTLWDVSEYFLKNPWKWKSLWKKNPHIENPHLIYPNDIIILKYDQNNKPYILIERGVKEIKLSPNIKETVFNSIPMIDTNNIKNHLSKNEIISEYSIKEYDTSLLKETLLATKNDYIYTFPSNNYYEKNKSYIAVKDIIPLYKNNELKAYHLIKSGDLKVENISNEVVKLKVTNSEFGIKEGDRIYEVDSFNTPYLFPDHYQGKSGEIVFFDDNLKYVGKNNNVILNIGDNENLNVGDILEIYENDVIKNINGQKVTLSGDKAGELIVYKVYKDFSYGLITKSYSPIGINYKVTSPENYFGEK